MKERRTPNAKPERAYVGLHDLFDRLPPTSPPFPPPPKSIKRATRSAVIKDRPTRTAGEGKDTVEKGGKEGHRLRVLPSALLPRRYRSAREGQPARGLRNAPACPPALLRERVRERENERESASEEKTEREREACREQPGLGQGRRGKRPCPRSFTPTTTLVRSLFGSLLPLSRCPAAAAAAAARWEKTGSEIGNRTQNWEEKEKKKNARLRSL